MQLYLAVTPDRLDQALALTPHIAHIAYRVSEDGALLQRPLPASLRGGIMVLQCPSAVPAHRAEPLAREVLHTCICRNFSGILLTAPSAADISSAARWLQQLARQHHRCLYVPESCAQSVPEATVLLCTALSGGSLQQRLTQAVQQYAAQRIALDLQRLMMSFPLPCPSGEGHPLSLKDLRQQQQGHSVYYCDALCAHYFTQQHGGQPRFVLYDDANTLLRKMELAEKLGISQAFISWPETADLLPQLFVKKKEGEP